MSEQSANVTASIASRIERIRERIGLPANDEAAVENGDAQMTDEPRIEMVWGQWENWNQWTKVL